MSGLTHRRVLSLALAWAVSSLAPIGAAGSPRLAGPGRGEASARQAFRLVAPRLAGAAAPSASSYTNAFLISSFPAKTGSSFHTARFRGRAAWRVSGTSSSRPLPARWSSLPTGFHSRMAEGLTDPPPSRSERGGETPGTLSPGTAIEAKRRFARLPLSAGRP